MKENLLILPAVLLAILLINSNPLYQNEAKTAESIQYHATVCIYKNGELVYCGHNLLTDIGKEYIEDQLISPNSQASLRYISLSNSSTDCTASSTILPGELTIGGLTRANCTITDLGNGKWSCEYTFTLTDTVYDIRQAGYNWNSTPNSDNNLFACDTFPAISLESGDTLTVRWNVTFNATSG